MHSQVQSTISRSQHYVWNTIQPDWIVSGWSEMYCTSQWLSLYRKLFDVLKCWKIASWLPHTHGDICIWIVAILSIAEVCCQLENRFRKTFRVWTILSFHCFVSKMYSNLSLTHNNDGDDDDKKSRTGKVKCAQHVTLTYTCHVVNRESYSMVLEWL